MAFTIINTATAILIANVITNTCIVTIICLNIVEIFFDIFLNPIVKVCRSRLTSIVGSRTSSFRVPVHNHHHQVFTIKSPIGATNHYWHTQSMPLLSIVGYNKMSLELQAAVLCQLGKIWWRPSSVWPPTPPSSSSACLGLVRDSS